MITTKTPDIAALVIVGIAIFGARTLAAIRRAAEQCAAEAAKAANLAADEFVATHRPRIHLRRGYQVLVQLGHAAAILEFANRGETDAHVVEVGVDLFPRNRASSAMVNYHALPRPQHLIIPPGKNAIMNVHGVSNLTQSDVEAINAGDVELCLLSIVNYTDNRGLLRSVSAFRRYDPDRRRFLHVAEDDEFAEWEYED